MCENLAEKFAGKPKPNNLAMTPLIKTLFRRPQGVGGGGWVLRMQLKREHIKDAGNFKTDRYWCRWDECTKSSHLAEAIDVFI